MNKIKALLRLYKEVYNIDGLYLETLQNINVKDSMRKENDKEFLLNILKEKIKNCKDCPLWETRTNTVFGEGNINAKLMFIGEGPGYEEDKQARPFVGRAGELLTKIINAMNMKREDVYIANIVKCHPLRVPDPELRNNDRPPNDEEISKCINYLEKQIEIIMPKIICCLGSTAARVLTKNDLPRSELRGKIFDYYKNNKIKVLPT
ncbi:MAG: uracil-DNA glycosylase, partial [Endomicrobiia bacterium]